MHSIWVGDVEPATVKKTVIHGHFFGVAATANDGSHSTEMLPLRREVLRMWGSCSVDRCSFA